VPKPTTTPTPSTVTMTSTTPRPWVRVDVGESDAGANVTLSVVVPGDAHEETPTIEVSVPIMATLGSACVVLALLVTGGVAIWIRRRKVSRRF
jgi:hypothetical protein